jgi:hypothetical protein
MLAVPPATLELEAGDGLRRWAFPRRELTAASTSPLNDRLK